MSEEKDAFHLVRKGDVVGIYKSLSDIQVLLASSVGSLEIYKGHSLSKKAEDYLTSHGITKAAYSISAADVSEGLFGRIVACPYQQPYHSGGKLSDINLPSKVLQGAHQLDNNLKVAGSSLFSSNSERRQILNAAQSNLSTCMKGSWKTKNANMAFLCNEAKELTDEFLSYQINHVLSEYNPEADVQANLAVNLRAGQVEEDCQC